MYILLYDLELILTNKIYLSYFDISFLIQIFNNYIYFDFILLFVNMREIEILIEDMAIIPNIEMHQHCKQNITLIEYINHILYFNN